jgi:hypothetical protein
MKQIMKQVGMMVACVFALAQVGDAWAADANPPERMTYQGYLVDSNGAPLGDSVPANYDVVFRIYNIKTGGTTDNILWAEQQTVTVDKGYFTVLLGEGVASANGDPNGDLSAVFAGSDASDRFIGITIKGLDDSDLEIAPRLRLVASPFTFLAAYARQADKIVGTGGDVLTTDGGNIGIGNATPNSKLDVGGDIKASGAVDVGGNANVQGQLAVGKSTAPGAALDVVGTIKASSGLDIDGESTIDGSLTVRPTGSSSALRISASSIYSGYQLKLWNDDSASYIRNDSDSRKIIIGANNRSTLALTPDGKVGINNSSPSYDLDVDGTIRASSLIVDGSLTVPGLTLNGWVGRTAHNNGALVGSYNNVGANALKTNPIYVIGSNYKPADSTLSNMFGVGFTDGGASFISGSASGWGLYVASDGDARTFLSGDQGAVSYINRDGGKVGVGTHSPSTMLHLNATTDAELKYNTIPNPLYPWVSSVQFVTASVGSDSQKYGVLMIGSRGGVHIRVDSDEIMAVNNNSAATLYLNKNGGTVVAGSATVTSDKRLKQNIHPIKYGLSELRGLKPVSYDWKLGLFNLPGTQLGFIAQDVQKVLPELVTVDANTEESRFEDELSLNVNGIMPVVVASVQELDKENRRLNSEVETLKSEMAVLKARLANSTTQEDRIAKLEELVSKIGQGE